MSQQSVIEELQHLGMSGYEAKAYVAKLKSDKRYQRDVY